MLVGPAEADDASKSEKEGVRMNEARARTSLFSLMILGGAVVSLALVMLVVRRARN